MVGVVIGIPRQGSSSDGDVALRIRSRTGQVEEVSNALAAVWGVLRCKRLEAG